MNDDHILQGLTQLNLTLPAPAMPIAAYRPVRIAGPYAYVSGQLPMTEAGIISGCLGEGLSIEEGKFAAQACGLMILAQLRQALGSLDPIRSLVRLGVFVSSTPEFRDHALVANGASELFQHLWGERGYHARSAVGVAALPLGAAVEIDAIVEIEI